MCTCDQALAWINQAVDNCITEEDRAVLQAHLSECPECRGLFEAYRQIQAGLLELEAEPPKTLARGVMQSIRAERKKKPLRYVFATAGTLAAALVLVFLGGSMLSDMGFGSSAESDAMNGSTTGSTMRNTEYSVADTATGADTMDAPQAENTSMDDMESVTSDCDAGEMPVVDAGTGGTQIVSGDSASYRPLSDYAIVLIYHNVDALGDYARELSFMSRPEGMYCVVSIALAEEIYDACPGAVSYEINQKPYMAMDASIVLIQP